MTPVSSASPVVRAPIGGPRRFGSRALRILRFLRFLRISSRNPGA